LLLSPQNAKTAEGAPVVTFVEELEVDGHKTLGIVVEPRLPSYVGGPCGAIQCWKFLLPLISVGGEAQGLFFNKDPFSGRITLTHRCVVNPPFLCPPLCTFSI
jgi:hypothetical protein